MVANGAGRYGIEGGSRSVVLAVIAPFRSKRLAWSPSRTIFLFSNFFQE